MIKSAIKCTILVALSTLALTSCKTDGGGNGNGSTKGGEAKVVSKKAGSNVVDIHQLADSDGMNTFTSTSANASVIQGYIYGGLLTTEPIAPYKIVPTMAKARPTITTIAEGEVINGITYDKGGNIFEYEIRDEAVWDNGTPITAMDYVFSRKAIKSPLSDCPHLKPYMEFTQDVVIDPTNPKKFKVYGKGTYFTSETWTAYTILPEYMYDKDQRLRKYDLADFNDPKKLSAMKSDKNMIDWAATFNGEKHNRDAAFISGSGPYKFKEWITGKHVILEKKKDWWAEGLDDNVFHNGPEKLVFKIVNDWTTAITAMKDEDLDLANGIVAKAFVDLTKNDNFKKMYSLETPDYMVYDYIGIHLKNDKFKDVKTRKALAHLVDKQLIADVIMYGYGFPTVGPIHPTKDYYNKNITPYSFDLEKAKTLLAEAGWKDEDGDGFLEKKINGKVVPFKTSILYNSGNSRRENICLMFKENAKVVGIDVDVQVKEWTVFIEETKAHNFELYCGGWAGSTNLDDLKQIWHSESYNGGSNYVGFGSAESDKLIEEIRYNMDKTSRDKQYMEIQKMIHENVPYVFLNAHKNKLAMHKRFDNANGYVPRPGYDVSEWMINENFGTVAASAN